MATATARAIDMGRERRAAELEDQATIAAGSSTEVPPIPRFILEDRYDGLMCRRTGVGRGPNDPSGLQGRLDRVVRDLVAGVSRIPWTGDLEGDQTGAVLDSVENVIRQTVIYEIDRRGIAR